MTQTPIRGMSANYVIFDEFAEMPEKNLPLAVARVQPRRLAKKPKAKKKK